MSGGWGFVVSLPLNRRQTLWSREPLNKPPRRLPLSIRAFCGVANPRDSYGYHCGLRLAAHPERQRILAARLIQRLPNSARALRANQELA